MKFLDWIFKFINKNKINSNRSRPLTDDQFNDRRAKRREKLDSILDKISKDGYDSLSNHERNFLDNYGKN